jgi:Protein of unknown function (DUF1266)
MINPIDTPLSSFGLVRALPITKETQAVALLVLLTIMVVVYFSYKRQEGNAHRTLERLQNESGESHPEEEGPQEAAAEEEDDDSEEAPVPKTLSDLDPEIFSLTPERLMIVALGAQYSQMGGKCQKVETKVREQGLTGEMITAAVIESLGKIDYGAHTTNAGVIPHCLDVLRSSWGLHDTEDVISMVEKLISGLHQSRWHAMVTSELMTSHSNSRAQAFARQHHWRLGPAGILAWDQARAVHVTRLATAGGWLTPKQAWQLLAPLPGVARQAFPSWQAYAQSYLAGLEFWMWGNCGDSELDQDDQTEIRTLTADAHVLLDHPYSIWKLAPWPTN